MKIIKRGFIRKTALSLLVYTVSLAAPVCSYAEGTASFTSGGEAESALSREPEDGEDTLLLRKAAKDGKAGMAPEKTAKDDLVSMPPAALWERNAQDTQPGETGEGDAQDTQPGETGEGDAQNTRPGETEEGDVQDTRPGETEEGDAQDTQPGETEEGDAQDTQPGETEETGEGIEQDTPPEKIEIDEIGKALAGSGSDTDLRAPVAPQRAMEQKTTEPQLPAATPSEVKPQLPPATPSEAKPQLPAATPSEVKPQLPAATPSEAKPQLPPATPSEAKPQLSAATPSEAKSRQNGCTTIWELKELLESEGPETILLENDIVLAPGDSVYLYPEEGRQVDMNGHRLIIPQKACLSINGPVCFKGTVRGEALIQGDGQLLIYRVRVEAEGEGAVAVKISGENAHGERFGISRAQIHVTGSRGIAVLWEGGACKLHNVTVKAEGQGSTGVWADGDVYLSGSSITAEGTSVMSGSGSIALDQSSAVPWPEGAREVRWEAYCSERMEENGISVEAGSPYSCLLGSLLDEIEYILYSPQEKRTTVSDVPVAWDNLPEDISVPGEYTAIARPLMDAGGIKFPDTHVPIHVVAAEKPHIQEIFRMEKTVVFRYLAEIRQSESIALFCSSDGGVSWRDTASMEGCVPVVSPYTAALEGLEINHEYLFKLGVSGGPMEGESAAIPFSYYWDDADRYGQGDRDNGDRGDQGESLPGGGSSEEKSEPSGYTSGKTSSNHASEQVGKGGKKIQEYQPSPAVSIDLTGQELKDQIEANPDQVTLLAGNVKVIIPSASLKLLDLSGTDLFTAVLAETPEGGLEVRFWVNHEKIHLTGVRIGAVEEGAAGTDGNWKPTQSQSVQETVYEERTGGHEGAGQEERTSVDERAGHDVDADTAVICLKPDKAEKREERLSQRQGEGDASVTTSADTVRAAVSSMTASVKAPVKESVKGPVPAWAAALLSGIPAAGCMAVLVILRRRKGEDR